MVDLFFNFISYYSFKLADPTKPYVKLIPSEREIKVAEKTSKVKVVCTYVSGLPRPTMIWKDPKGNVVHDCDEYNVNCTLNLYNVQYAKNHGRYTCEANNRAGNYKIDFMMNILGMFQGIYLFSMIALCFYFTMYLHCDGLIKLFRVSCRQKKLVFSFKAWLN